jgi:hypothetical protein
LNIKYDEDLLNEVVLAIDYVLEHLEKKTSTPGDINKFLTIVFYAQATLVECYTKILKLDKANQVYSLDLYSLQYFYLLCMIIINSGRGNIVSRVEHLSRLTSSVISS